MREWEGKQESKKLHTVINILIENTHKHMISVLFIFFSRLVLIIFFFHSTVWGIPVKLMWLKALCLTGKDYHIFM